MFRLWQLPLPILFFTPFASLVFLINFGFVGVGGGFGSGLDSERAFTFGSLSLLSIRLGLVAFCPSGYLVRWLGSLPPLFIFLWGLGTPGFMDRVQKRIFPSGCFIFQLWGCPASALAVAGKGGSVLRAHPFFGTVAWCLFVPLLFPSYATRCRYAVPGSGLAASACSYACGRCLGIALGPGSGFPFVSLPCGRVV